MITTLYRSMATYSSINYPTYEVWQVRHDIISLFPASYVVGLNYNLSLVKSIDSVDITQNWLTGREYTLNTGGTSDTYYNNKDFVFDYNNLLNKNFNSPNPFLLNATVSHTSNIPVVEGGNLKELISPILSVTFSITNNNQISTNIQNLKVPINGINLPGSTISVSFDDATIPDRDFRITSGTISSIGFGSLGTYSTLITGTFSGSSVIIGKTGTVNFIKSLHTQTTTTTYQHSNSTHQYLDGNVNDDNIHFLKTPWKQFPSTYFESPSRLTEFSTQFNIHYFHGKLIFNGQSLFPGDYLDLYTRGGNSTIDIVEGAATGSIFEWESNYYKPALTMQQWFDTYIRYKFDQIFPYNMGYTYSTSLGNTISATNSLNIELINTKLDSYYDVDIPFTFLQLYPNAFTFSTISETSDGKICKVYDNNYNTLTFNHDHSLPIVATAGNQIVGFYKNIVEYDTNLTVIKTSQYNIQSYVNINPYLTTNFYKQLTLSSGPQNLKDAGYTFSTNCKYYDVTIGITQSLANANMISRHEIVPNCSIYDNVRVMFLNREGGYDYWNFNKDSKRTVNINDRKEYKKLLNYDYSIGDRGSTVYSQIINDTYMINTDWVSEEDYLFLEQLITSPDVYIIDEVNDNKIPIVITDSSYVIKTALRDSMFNVTLSYKLAYNTNIQNL